MAEEKISKEEKKNQKKEEQAKKKKYNRQIKSVLTGNLKRGEDGKLRAGKVHLVTRWGVGDGAKETLLFGLKKKTFRFNTTFNNSKQALYHAERALQDLGLRVYLECEPDAIVCFVKPVVFRPVVLVLKENKDEQDKEKKKGSLILYAFCGRAIMTFFSIKRVVSRFEKLVGDKFERLE